jgi:hypothetical protein
MRAAGMWICWIGGVISESHQGTDIHPVYFPYIEWRGLSLSLPRLTQIFDGQSTIYPVTAV